MKLAIIRAAIISAAALARDKIISPLNRVDVVNNPAIFLKLSSARGVIAANCAVGDVNIGLVGYAAFPTGIDAIVINWGQALYTANETDVLKFPLDAVFIKVDAHGATVTDIILVNPKDGKTRQPHKSDLVVLFRAGDAQRKNIQIGDKWTANIKPAAAFLD